MTVKKLAQGGAAELEGTLRVGDMIVGVNRHEVLGIGKELVELVCGPAGSLCELAVLRDGRMLPPVVLSRAHLPVASGASNFGRTYKVCLPSQGMRGGARRRRSVSVSVDADVVAMCVFRCGV